VTETIAANGAPVGGVVGAMVQIAEGVWVNTLHVAAVVPIEGIKRGEPTLQCRVYVAGPSLGGGHVLAWNSLLSPMQMVGKLNVALANAMRERGFWEEKGRIDALDTAGEEEDDE
jgi:hypothetical protein